MLDGVHDLAAAGDPDPPTLPWLTALPGGVGVLTSWTTRDGSARLASSGTDATIQIWDPERQTRVGGTLRGHTDGVWTLQVWQGPDRTILFSTGEDGTIRQWDPDEGTAIGKPLTGHVGWVRALAIWDAPDGTPRLASAGTDGTVRLWDPLACVPLGEPLVVRHVPLQALSALATWDTPDGTRLATAGDDGTVRIWNPDTRTLIQDRQLDHGVGIWALAAWTAADGSARLAASGPDGSIHVWDPTEGVRVGSPLVGHDSWVPTLATWGATDGSTRLISASTDGTIRQWDAATGRPIGAPLVGHSDAISALTTWTAPDGGERLAFAGESGSIKIWDADAETLLGELPVAHTAGRWALTSWPDTAGTRLAVGGDDGEIQIWNADTGQMIGEPLRGHTAAVWALVAWSGPGASRMLASAGDDGSVRIWNTLTARQVGPPLLGHSGWVPALTTWQRPDGTLELISGGIDGTIRRWDPADQRPVDDAAPMVNGAWVMSLVTWNSRSGPRLACGDTDGLIRVWDLESPSPLGDPIVAHDGWVRSLTTWADAEGDIQLVSGGYDGTIRRWNPATGEPIGDVMSTQEGRVAALVTWQDNGARLASTGSDSLIRIWDLNSARQIGHELAGHNGGLWALAAWVDAHGRARVASSGYNGEVWLWDPRTGRPLRTIECGPVAMWGISDAPTTRDTIGRLPLAKAIADQLCRVALSDDSGPTVIGIEGPWGSGKSTLMKMVKDRLPLPEPRSDASKGKRFLTVHSVLRQIRRYTDTETAPPQPPGGATRGVVTAWFNPWTYQSGEQVWAGLANEIIESAAVVLYPTEAHREHYWFAHNLGRIDRYALRRSLRLRTISPVLGVALLGSVALAVAQLSRPLKLISLSFTPTVAALLAAVAFVVIGTVHTIGRRAWGRAVHYMPSDLVTGPVLDGLTLGGADGRTKADADPLHHARAGALYLHQHGIDDIIDDLTTEGYDLVVFVDDIDRCRAGTAAEVFEAINLFLSNVASRGGLRARFVVGLDSVVVASHLDDLYAGHSDLTAVSHGDDPSPGWAFLRKLIQIPVHVPHVTDIGVERLVDAIIGPEQPREPSPPPMGPDASGQHASRGAAARSRPRIPRQRIPGQRVLGQRMPGQRILGQRAVPSASMADAPPPATRPAVDTFTWRSTERHPQFHTFVVERLSAQPSRSIREAKRLLNVWQLYARILDTEKPLSDPLAIVDRAKNLLILAEIVTRWPAIQAGLQQRIDGSPALRLLAEAVDDDERWHRAVRRTGIDPAKAQRALVNLRALLTEHNGVPVALLAAALM